MKQTHKIEFFGVLAGNTVEHIMNVFSYFNTNFVIIKNLLVSVSNIFKLIGFCK